MRAAAFDCDARPIVLSAAVWCSRVLAVFIVRMSFPPSSTCIKRVRDGLGAAYEGQAAARSTRASVCAGGRVGRPLRGWDWASRAPAPICARVSV